MFSSLFSSRGTSRVLKVAVVALLLVVLTLGVVACGKASIVGKWQDSDGETVEFTSDGKMIGLADAPGIEVTYKIDGDQLLISAMGIEMPVKFVLDGDSLQLQDPDTGEMQTAKRVK